MGLVPCRFCGVVPEIIGRSAPNRVWRAVRHNNCRSAYHETDEEAAAEWNAANAATDPALLALARLSAKLVRRGLGDGFTLGDLLVADALESGVFVPMATGAGYTGPVFAPGIAAAITALLAPDVADVAGEVARECKCRLRTRLVGDGCDVCNPELAAEYARQREATDA